MELASENQIVEEGASAFTGKRAAVTGGSGNLGLRICELLLRAGADRVRCLDISLPADKERQKKLIDGFGSKIQFLIVDVTDAHALRSAVEGLDVMFHVASYGMSGTEMRNHAQIENVNVCGTVNVISACCDAGIGALVYTSTYNVVFGGQPVEGGDETMPYYPLGRHFDHYSRTKCKAERLILEANSRPLAPPTRHSPASPGGGGGGGGEGWRRVLRTAAIRPAAMYGEGERRHIGRMLHIAETGLLRFTIGDDDSKVDWVHVDNVAHAHMLAAARLLHSPTGVAGEAFFISDECPVNNFQFLRPILVEGMGISAPSIRIPLKVALLIAYILERIPTYMVPPPLIPLLLSRAEVVKVGVTHWFKTDKARTRLEWRPIVTPTEGVRRTVAFVRRLRAAAAAPPPAAAAGRPGPAGRLADWARQAAAAAAWAVVLLAVYLTAVTLAPHPAAPAGTLAACSPNDTWSRSHDYRALIAAGRPIPS